MFAIAIAITAAYLLSSSITRCHQYNSDGDGRINFNQPNDTEKRNLMLANLKLRNRMLLGYSIPVVLSLGLAGIVYSSSTKVVNSFEQASISHNLVVETDDMAIASGKMVRSLRGYLLTNNEKYLKNYEEAKQEFRKHAEATVKVLQASKRTKSDEETINHLIDLQRQIRYFDGPLITLIKEEKKGRTVQMILEEKSSELVETIEKKIAVLNTQEEEKFSALKTNTSNSMGLLNSVVILGTLISNALAVIAAILISLGVARKLTEAASAITTSSTQITATVEQQERTVSQQAASVNQTTITMDELGASSQQSAQQAEASAAGARQALSLAEGGTLAVQQTMEGMETLKEKVGAIADQILRLSEQTNQIGGISGLVGDLANQTNMLALNAAVEAARAGEHGLGFGVVAAEIRKLADQSKASAQKINALVTDIQAAINTTVMVTNEETKNVDEGIKLAQGTAETFTGVADSINNVFLNTQQISLSAKQQAIAVQQVVEAMNSINLGAKESASGITQVKVNTQQLNLAAQKLKAVV